MANFRTLGSDFSTGLRAPHYTNGRLLTAEDLQQEQRTQLERLAQTGRAAGYGIVEGFAVTATANKSTLRVSAGLGLNRKGQVVHLAAESVNLPVQPVTDDGAPIRRAGRFEACSGVDADQPSTTTAGAYLLTAAPLAQLQGSVPLKSCDGTSTSTCANQWEVEGVEFKIIRLAGYQAPVGNRANRNRNLLAHWFYGSDELVTLMRDPLQFGANYTGFSHIAADDFTLCDLPLAVFFWNDNQIIFIDQWAVRRRLVHPYPAAKWAANLSDQRLAEGQARFLQFQEQAAELQATFGTQTDTLRAVDHFGYLPPVGILPVNPFELIITDIFEASLSERQIGMISQLDLTQAQVLERVRTGVLNSLGSSSAFSLDRFFGDLLPPEYRIVHEDVIHDRLHQSWVQPPILLPPPPAELVLFNFVLSDGTNVAVNSDNFTATLDNITSKFSGSVFSAALPAAGGSATGPGSTIISNRAVTSNLSLVNTLSVFKPPRDIFIPPTPDDDDEAEPLVDIFVVDELLDPYRNQLAETMSGRIDDAIASLSGLGGIFVGINTFTAFNQSVANAFTLNTFLWQGAMVGSVDLGQLLDLINKSKQPIFYVVFVRRRPAVISRPLRL